MRKLTLTRQLTALAAAAVLAGSAVTMAQSSRRSVPAPRIPQPQIQGDSTQTARTTDSRDLLNLIEDMENSTPEEIHSGRIGRYFTDPAVIITNGRMHRIDWSRVTDDRLDNRDRPEQDELAPPGQGEVRIE